MVRGLVRQQDSRLVRMASKEETHVPDLLHQLRCRCDGELREHAIAFVPIADARARLDEFMIVEGPVHLGDHSRPEAVLPDQHDGVEGVAEATEIHALSFVEQHRCQWAVRSGRGWLQPAARPLRRRQSSVPRRLDPGIGTHPCATRMGD
jgi:hypothetical protein